MGFVADCGAEIGGENAGKEAGTDRSVRCRRNPNRSEKRTAYGFF